MRTVTLNALLAAAMTLTAVSAQASLADRKSDEAAQNPAVSAPYSGQVVIRGQVVSQGVGE